jgi:hypothetical protein
MAIRNMTGTFTRPADTTAYASGDLVANSTTNTAVDAVELKHIGNRPAGTGIIRRVVLRKSGTGTTNASFRVHLMRGDPATVTNGDNGAFSISGVADYLGYADVTIGQAFTDGAWGAGAPAVGSEFMIRLGPAEQDIWAMVEARGAYTPASAEVFVVGVDLIDETP